MSVLKTCFSPVRFKMNPEELILRFYSPDSKTFKILLEHGKCVAEKSL